ncbi:MAG: hypothetical protein AAGA48_24125 [Myxococcota bacterium]
MRVSWLLWGLVGCGADPASPTLEDAVARQELSATDHLVRVSMALRGLRPSVADLETVAADPDAIEAIVDRYLEAPEFGDTVRDMHAELFRSRVDILRTYLSYGPLTGVDQLDIDASVAEGPLRLVEAVVMEDRPYTDIVTSDEAWVDARSARVWGVTYDPQGDDWQAQSWPDARPAAGLLTDSALFARHMSVGGNANRGRAELIANALLCQSFLERDVNVDGSIDLADEAAVADAVETNAGCVSCHQALDPLAASFWPHRGRVNAARIRFSYDENGQCIDDSDYCYPIRYWVPELTLAWQRLDLRSPGFYGAPTDDLAHLGDQIADDPRFSLCTAQRVDAYLTQTPTPSVPHERAAQWQQTLVDSGFSLRTMIKQIVLSDAFRTVTGSDEDANVGLQTVRPEQYARLVEQLTGFEWGASADRPALNCTASNACLGDVDLATTDLFGFRAMSGGIDGLRVTFPAHSPTPIKTLVMSTFANEAAGYIVAADFAAPPAQRQLLTMATPTADEAMDRAQLVELHARILGQLDEPDSEAIDATYGLLETVRAETGAPDAWRAVVSALLQHPRLMFY